MRTREDFDRFYAKPDPWGIAQARARDRVLRRTLARHIKGRFVLELGCGEGHLTETLFSEAKSVTGIDISAVAIERARARHLRNASFICGDFLETPFADYDVIAAIECLYYLSSDEQDRVLDKIVREHRGRIVIFSAPIVGDCEHRKYYTHSEIIDTLDRRVISLTEFHNLNLRTDRHLSSFAARILNSLPGVQVVLDLIPRRLIYQRCYLAQASSRLQQAQRHISETDFRSSVGELGPHLYPAAEACVRPEQDNLKPHKS